MVFMAPPKKRRGPRPDPDSKRSKGGNRHLDPRKSFHASQELFDALERFVDETKPQPSESSVLRDALIEYLVKRGHWPPKQAESEDAP